MTSPTDEAEYADENDPEEGASTAEYGIVMLAAVGFAGLLVAILKSDEIRGMLVDMVKNGPCNGRFWADLLGFSKPSTTRENRESCPNSRKERL